MSTDDEQASIDQVTARLSARFADVHPDAVAAVVNDVHREFDGRPIRAYVPLLVEHRAADLLRGMEAVSVVAV